MRHRCIPLALFLLSLLPPQMLPAANKETVPAQWSVRGAVQYALNHNPDAKAAVERIKAADADIKAAKASFYPQLGVSAEYSRTNNPMYSFGNILNQGVFTDTIDFNNPGTTDNLQTKATLQYRLYNGGHDLAALDAADERGRAAGNEQAAIRSRLEFEVVRAFCTIVQATETVRARQSALEAIDASVAVARARFSEGSLLKEDLLNLEVQQSRTQEQLIQARHGLNLAQRGFLHLLGLTGESVQLNMAASPDQEIPVERDIRTRPELTGMAAMIKAGEAMVRQARAGFYPTADAIGSYQVDKGTELEGGSGNSWATGVRLNYTLFNGQQTSAATERAEAQLRVAKEQQRKMELAFNLEMEQAALTLNQEEERLKVTGKMVESATESARLARLRFKEGVLLSSELINTENRLTDARLSHALATSSRKIAIADLRRAVGLAQFNQEK
ncbi:TolC family protein [uncultured Desulfobulbus sp.]|uniref:TolC family protein n=1 Tax=uncultured Desulfobulbus sp. TaxID=239745 RepID=UPI0029C86A23|nr:TolC family protein [uncultured Desulfobulbus sp.]